MGLYKVVLIAISEVVLGCKWSLGQVSLYCFQGLSLQQ